MPDPLTDFLLQLFRAHGVDAQHDGEWVILPRPYMRARAAIVSETPHPNQLIVQLDVQVFVGFGQLMVESCAGWGATRDAAIKNAQESFMAGSFHVILGAFFGPNEQVEREQWIIIEPKGWKLP